MSQAPLTPTRKKQLEAYIKCIKRREAAIKYGARYATYQRSFVYVEEKEITRRGRLHKLIRERGFAPYAKALLCLKEKRSQCAAELSGLGYHG
jgi:hypothetical protein